MQGRTQLAIHDYLKVVRTIHKLESMVHQLGLAVALVPDEDMEAYITATAEIDKAEAKRCKQCQREIGQLKREVVAELGLN